MVNSPRSGVWCSGLTRCPVKAETEGSNPFIPAKPPGYPGGPVFARGPIEHTLSATPLANHSFPGGIIDLTSPPACPIRPIRAACPDPDRGSESASLVGVRGVDLVEG